MRDMVHIDMVDSGLKIVTSQMRVYLGVCGQNVN